MNGYVCTVLATDFPLLIARHSEEVFNGHWSEIHREVEDWTFSPHR